MASIRFVVPGVAAKKFSGGLLCVFEYANGLQDMGHNVVITPLVESETPLWFSPRFNLDKREPKVFGRPLEIFRNVAKYLRYRDQESKAVLRQSVVAVNHLTAKYGGYNYARARAMERFRLLPMESDITIATSFETALPVAVYGAGKKFYFMQHYEPLCVLDYDRAEEARLDAELTYHLPLRPIANSSWLRNQLQEKHNRNDTKLNCNAIDHNIFFPDGHPPESNIAFVVISYGGRNVTWKGFREAAEAIREAKQYLPNLEWRVYGDALLPPDNSIAPYTHLGFITGEALRRAYSQSHVTLCPSWYESFPLFPLEAMACGSVVVTTPFGVEDYVTDGQNALVVPPRDPRAMAEALLRLANDQQLRERLRQAALIEASKFTWGRAIKNFSGNIFYD